MTSRLAGVKAAAAVYFSASFLPSADAQIPSDGQEAPPIRRAIPLEAPEPPVRRAVPVETEPELTPTPTPEPTAPNLSEPDQRDLTAEPTPAPGTIRMSQPDEIQLELANAFYAQRLYDMAAPEYEKYLGMYPNAPERETALFRLGESYRAMGSLNSAKQSYETLLASFPTGEFLAPAAYRLGDVYFREGNYHSALPLFRRAMNRTKDPAVANAAKFYLARSLEELRQYSEARRTYTDLLETKEKNPFREASHAALARLLAEADKKAEAVEQYQQLAKETEKPQLKVEATVRAALLQIDLGESEKAAASLKRALAMPDIGAWRNVAELGLLRVLYASGKYQDIIEAHRSAGDKFGEDTRVESTLLAANAYRQLNKHEQARELYESVIEQAPESDYAKTAQYERLVSLYMTNSKDLIPAVDQYVAQQPPQKQRDQATLLKAEALYRTSEFGKAADVYATLSDSTLPKELKAETLYKLGWSHMQTGNFERAIEAYAKFLNQHPDHKLAPSALAQRGIAYQRLKDFDAALKDFNALINKHPKARERELALQQKALILGQQQENRAMSETFRKLLEDYPKSKAAPQAYYWIGWAGFEQKDYKNAIAPLDKARTGDEEQFYERATLRIMLSHYYLEQPDELAREVDAYVDEQRAGKVPADILRWLGAKFAEQKEWEKSEKFLKFLEQGAGSEEAAPSDWLAIARSQLEQKKCKEAEESVLRYLSAVKEPHPKATGLLVLGRAQLCQEQYEQAQQSADEALALQPEGRLNADGRTLSGDIQMALGNFEEAAKLFLSVAVVFDDADITPRALEKAYQAYKKAGKADEAAKILNQLQTRFPEYALHEPLTGSAGR
jgi:TolA-binding protein